MEGQTRGATIGMTAGADADIPAPEGNPEVRAKCRPAGGKDSGSGCVTPACRGAAKNDGGADARGHHRRKSEAVTEPALVKTKSGAIRSVAGTQARLG